MQAIVQRRFGGPEVLELEEVPDLEPGPGQVRLAVAAAGVHLLDTTIRAGDGGGPFPIPDLPMVPGREVAGVVDRVGNEVEPAWLGAAVAAHLGPASGGYAAQALVPVESLLRLPAGVAPTDAVAMVGTGRTALGILEVAELTAADVVLVTAAAGGLGALLVQAGVRAGATVVGVAGGPEKVALVERLGADLAVDYRAAGWAERVTEGLGGKQVTVALDGVGGATGRAAFDLVAPGGRVVLYGTSGGEPMPLSVADLFASGVTVSAAVGARMFARPGGIQGLAAEALERLGAGWWRPVVNPPHRLADAAQAHRDLVERRTTGKVVLVPSGL
jgi:NADPH2:quinone reductase